MRVILSCRLAYDTFPERAPKWPGQPRMIPASTVPLKIPEQFTNRAGLFQWRSGLRHHIGFTSRKIDGD